MGVGIARSGERTDAVGTPAAAALEALFGKLRPSLSGADSRIATRLSALLDVLRPLEFGAAERSRVVRLASPEAGRLASMLEDLRGPLRATEQAGSFGNPWSAASLRRDEVRNAAALAWHLDPRGGHGHGDCLLRGLLAVVTARVGTFPASPSAACRVTVEECPDGARDSRVDIQVDDPGRFFLIIEVKIDAPEQPGQIDRYCGVARARACDRRPWAVIFLTVNGGMPVTGDANLREVVSLRWAWIAARLRRLAATYRGDEDRPVPRYLATAFADHIMTFGRRRNGRS